MPRPARFLSNPSAYEPLPQPEVPEVKEEAQQVQQVQQQQQPHPEQPEQQPEAKKVSPPKGKKTVAKILE